MPVVFVRQATMLHTIRPVNFRPGLVALMVILGLLLNNAWVSAHTHAPADAEAHAAFHGVTPARHDLVHEGPARWRAYHTGADPIAGHPFEETVDSTAARRTEIEDELGDLKVAGPVGFSLTGVDPGPVFLPVGPAYLARELRVLLQVFLI